MSRTCEACNRPIPTGTATLRGNGHRLLAWHRDCFIVVRALAEIRVHDCASPMPLTRRLEAARERMSA